MDDTATVGQVRDEMADVLAYLLRLADVLPVDLEAALAAKIVKNAVKYPLDAGRGAGRESGGRASR